MKVKVTPPLSGANLAACAWLAGLLFGLLEWAHLEQLAHSTPSPIYSTPLLGATTVGVAMLVATGLVGWQLLLRAGHGWLDRGPLRWRQTLFVLLWPVLNFTLLTGLTLLSVMRLPMTFVVAYAVGLVGAVVSAFLLRHAMGPHVKAWQHHALVVLLVAAAALAWWLNNGVLRRQNHTIHFALTLISIVGWQLAGLLVLARWPARWPRVVAPAGVLLTAALLGCLQIGLPTAYGVKNLVFERGEATWRSVTMLSSVADLDRDGYAALLVGADCDDMDASVHPATEEKALDCLRRWHPDAARLPQPASQTNLPAGQIDFKRRPRPVLMLTIDAVRSDRLSLYGHHRQTTPRLQKMAETAFVGLAHESQAPGTRFTFKSLASMLLPDTVDRLERQGAAIPSVLPMLHEAGYRSVYISRVPHYYTTTVVRDVHEKHRPQTDDAAVKLALEAFAKDDPRQPFIWLHLWGPHDPYKHVDDVPDYGEAPADIYDENLLATDRRIGGLLDELQRRGVLQDAIVMLTSDHGEEFGDHGGVKHGLTLYRELLNVPLLIQVPGLAGMRWTTRTRTVDLMPTLLDLVGIDPASRWRPEGRSLLPWMLAHTQPAEVPGLAWIPASRAWHKVSLRQDGCTLIYDLKLRSVELYDHLRDPAELHNLVGRDAGLGSCQPEPMLAALLAWMSRRHDPQISNPSQR